MTFTGTEMAEFERRWRNAMERPNNIRLIPPLPRKVRICLAYERAVTCIGVFLGDHVSWSAARLLWWITGLIV